MRLSLILICVVPLVGCDDASSSDPLADSGSDVGPGMADGGVATAVDAAPPDRPAPAEFQADSEQATLVDTARSGRNVGVRVYYPLGSSGEHALVLVSNGGIGELAGEDRLPHLGQRLAERGIVAITVGHQFSASLEIHREDRPADVSFVLDSIEDGTLPLPASFEGSVTTERVGHVGHSAGAYTSHVVGGATYPYGVFRDPRVAAIAPISPQGTGDFFEGFDNGADDNTWRTVDAVVLMLVGGEEISVNGIGIPQPEGWRLQPWSRYPDALDRHRILVPGQTHRNMGNFGSPDVTDYLAETVAQFFRVYLAGVGDACAVGTDRFPPGIEPEILRAPGTGDSALGACPNGR